MLDAAALAARFAQTLSPAQLTLALDPAAKACPRCDAPLVRRTSKHGSFWGCSTYPACTGKFQGG